MGLDTDTWTGLESRSDVLAAYFSRAVEEAIALARVGWFDQRLSPLGPRRHIEAVRRRIRGRQPGQPIGASIVGERHLLSLDALTEEYAALSLTARIARPGLKALQTLLAQAVRGAA